MADRWAVATDLNAAASWSATKGGAGGAGVPTSADNAYLAADSYNGPCTVSSAITCSQWTGRASEHGGTNFTGTLTINATITTSSTLPFRMTACTVVMNASGAIVADGITLTNNSLDMQTASILDSTEWIYLTGNTWVNTPRGIATNKYGDGANAGRQTEIIYAFDEYEVEASQVATYNANAWLTNQTSNATRIKGSIGVNTVISLGFGCKGAGTFLLDTNGDFIGTTGSLFFAILDGATITWNRATLTTRTGEIQFRAFSVDDVVILMRDWSNVVTTKVANDTGITEATFIPEAGTGKFNNFEINEGVDTSIIDNSVNNPSWEIADGFFNIESGAGTGQWVRGTGGLLFNGTLAATYGVNLNSQILEDIVVNAVNSIYQMITSNGITESFTITAGTFDINTFQLRVYGATSISGTLDVGVSGYLVFEGNVTFQSGSVFTATTNLSTLYADGGNLTIPNEKIWSTNNRGYLIVNEDCTIINQYFGNRFWDIEIEVTKTLTCGASPTELSWSGGDDCRIFGTLNMNGNTTWIGARAAGGEFRIGVSGDITGAGILLLRIYKGAAITIDKTSALSMTERVTFSGVSTAVIIFVCANFSNANCTFYCDGSNTTFELQGASDFKCVFLDCTETNGQSIIINNTNDKNLYTEEVDLTISGGGTFTWNRSATGIWYLTGSSGTKTIDWQELDIEQVYLNCAGAIKELPNDVNTISLDGDGGTLRSTVAATERTITVSATGQADNCTFKDIFMNAAERVNAKTGGVNQGNTKGIVFQDVLAPSLMSF